MNKKNYLYIGIPIVAVSVYFVFSIIPYGDDAVPTEFFPVLDFSYVDANSKLKESLGNIEISMSSPVKLSQSADIKKYCSFFANDEIDDIVEYCTSTELRTPDKKFLGNIHIVGSKDMPRIVLVVIQDDPLMQNLNDTKSVYDVVIDNLICACWEDVNPKDIETIGEWVDAQKNFHLSNVNPTSKSFLNLMGSQIQLELTTNTEGYLWKLMISKGS